MRSKVVLVALLLGGVAPAWAVNKCPGPGGKVVYQDAPCEGGEKVNISGAGVADPNSQGANYWKKESERQARSERVTSAIAQQKIFVGMTAEEARRSWGNPTKINTSVGSYGKHEQWVYRRGGAPAQYVYVENGMVSSMQSSE